MPVLTTQLNPRAADFKANADAMRGLIDSAASQEHQIALLWQAIEKLSDCVKTGDCVPDDAALKEQFEAGKLNDLVGK